MNSKSTAILATLLFAIGAVASAGLARDANSTVRSCTEVEAPPICTWVEMADGRIVELGATIPFSLVEAAPLDAEMVWPPRSLAVVPLPAEARNALGLDHMAVHWEAHGHPPALFFTPHFDFHFYSISEAEARAIDCSDESKPSRLPAGYALPDIEVPDMGVFVGLCVPEMGMHAMLADEVQETEAFGASMLIGYYGSEPIFFEPMISRDLLLRKSEFSLTMPAVSGLPEGVHYPRAFRATYDASEEAYRLVFTGFPME